ncbi:MarR family transcriptional regulator [Mannheimia indoligenes]|uniref:MarR family transcriptional regulator n=1 Tax=Mannheimia indoligenes TaxID=3103145 RepID=UPI002FE60C7A
MQNYLDQIGDTCTNMLISYGLFAKKYQINENELAILYTLWVEGACTQKHIAEKCQIAKQTINTLCKRWEIEEILQSVISEQDRREKTLYFTDKGRAFAQPIIEELLSRENQVINAFGIQRIKFLLDEFKALQTALSQKLGKHSG